MVQLNCDSWFPCHAAHPAVQSGYSAKQAQDLPISRLACWPGHGATASKRQSGGFQDHQPASSRSSLQNLLQAGTTDLLLSEIFASFCHHRLTRYTRTHARGLLFTLASNSQAAGRKGVFTGKVVDSVEVVTWRQRGFEALESRQETADGVLKSHDKLMSI